MSEEEEIPAVFALLSPSGQNDDEEDRKTEDILGSTEENNEMERPTFTYSEHCSQILAITCPIIMSEIFQNTMPVIDIIFVGRLGKDELAAAALATVWFNLWNTSMLGFCTAIDTFLAQSYGACELDSYKMWSGFSMIVVLFATFVVSGLCALCEPCMILFGQDRNIAAAAGEFSYRLLPGLFPYYAFRVCTKFLQSQDLILPGVIIGFLANGFNIFSNWLFIFQFDLGVNGAPWATSLTRAMQFVFMMIYLLWRRDSLADTWPSLSLRKLSYKVVKPFLTLAFSGMFSFAAEAWSFEVTTILAGLLGTIALDSHTITLNIATFIYLSFPFAVGIATSIKVGQLIGEGKAADARRSAIVAYGVNFVVQITLIAILWPCSRLLASLFSKDEEISDLVESLIPLSCIFMLGDAFQANTGGALRGLGRQKLVLLLNILGFWVLAVPFGAVLAFATNVGVRGLWWGFTVGLYSAAIIGILFLVFRVNWGKEAFKAQRRIAQTSQ